MVYSDPINKSYLTTPEGRYSLHSSKGHSCNFNPQRPVRLTFAVVETQPESPQKLIIFNSSDALGISNYATIDKSALRQVSVPSAGQQPVFPICHDHVRNVQKYDLVVGLSSGDVVVGSVKAQLAAPSANFKLLDMLHFNKGGQIDQTRAIDVAFLPGSHGGYFLAAHESGNIYMYSTVVAAASLANSSSKTPQTGYAKPNMTIKVSDKELRSCAVSPDGSKVASTTKDGILHIHDLSTGERVGGFKSFCGALLCCAWSYDNRYVAAGGEDDLVCVYGLLEQRQVFFGEGHESWVTRIAFDPWESNVEGSQNPSGQAGIFSGPERTTYRIASAGQDCKIMFWDFVAEDEDYFGPDETDKGEPAHKDIPSKIHRRTPSSSAVNALASMHSSSQLGVTGNLPPTIQPAVKQANMVMSSPVAAQAIHHDPCSDIIFIKDAMYTASYCCEIKCWLRAKPKEPESPSKASSVQDSPPQSG